MHAAIERRDLRRARLLLTHWHEREGELGSDVLRLVNNYVAPVLVSRVRREQTFELQAIRLREQIDGERRSREQAEAAARSSEQQAVRALRALDAGRREAAECEDVQAEARVQAGDRASAAALREQRAVAVAKYRALHKEVAEERSSRDEHITQLEQKTREFERKIRRARSA